MQKSFSKEVLYRCLYSVYSLYIKRSIKKISKFFWKSATPLEKILDPAQLLLKWSILNYDLGTSEAKKTKLVLGIILPFFSTITLTKSSNRIFAFFLANLQRVVFNWEKYCFREAQRPLTFCAQTVETFVHFFWQFLENLPNFLTFLGPPLLQAKVSLSVCCPQLKF